MKKVYFDRVENSGCIGIFMRDTEVISAGTTIYSMSQKDKNAEYRRFAMEYDINFIFDDTIPQVDFYTVPQFDIMAMDSCGGFIGTIGAFSNMDSDMPIGYMDRDRNCYFIAQNLKEFMKIVSNWKNCLIPFKDMLIFESIECAKEELEFFELVDG